MFNDYVHMCITHLWKTIRGTWVFFLALFFTNLVTNDTQKFRHSRRPHQIIKFRDRDLAVIISCGPKTYKTFICKITFLIMFNPGCTAIPNNQYLFMVVVHFYAEYRLCIVCQVKNMRPHKSGNFQSQRNKLQPMAIFTAFF